MDTSSNISAYFSKRTIIYIFLFIILVIVSFFIGQTIINKPWQQKLIISSEVNGLNIEANEKELSKVLDDFSNNKTYIIFDNEGIAYEINASQIEVIFTNNEQKHGMEAVSEDDLTIINSYSTQIVDNKLIMYIYVNSDYYSTIESVQANKRLTGVFVNYLYSITNYPLNNDFLLYRNTQSEIFQEYFNNEPLFNIQLN